MPDLGATDPADLEAPAASCLIERWAPNYENKDTMTGAVGGGGHRSQPVVVIMAENQHQHTRQSMPESIVPHDGHGHHRVDRGLVGGGGSNEGCRGEERPQTRETTAHG